MDIQAPKRTACDRCRDQKLKCLRSQPPNTTCDRCLRLGAACITSKGKPLGRPRLNTSPHIGRKANGNKSSSFGHRRAGGSSLGNLNLPSTANLALSPSQFPGSTNVGPSLTPTIFCSEPESDLLTAQFGDFDASAAVDPSIVFPWPQPWACPDSSLVPSLDFLSYESNQEVNNGESQGVMPDAGFVDAPSSEALTRSASLDGDPTAPLVVGLMRSISRQLAELKDQAWDPSRMLVKLLGGRDPDFCNPGKLNPLDDAMCISGRFIMVLQMMTPLNHSTASHRHSPPTLPLYLMLFSTYLQLCQLFETVLTDIQESLQGTTPCSDGSIGGFEVRRRSPVQPENNYVRMMTQYIEHQLNSVESLMCLPARYRLWSQKKDSNDIVDDGKTFPLTEAVMGQAEDIFQSLKKTIEEIQNPMMN